jgi:DNA repair protein RecN (Recombination protein N)
MLRHLSIRNFAIVESIELEFDSGFTALTGETGAGKSILIDALALALGERADAEQVKAGAERAEVCAEFSLAARDPLRAWLAELALEDDTREEADAVLLRRVLDRGGRSRAFINGRPATLAQLREAGERLVDIHGQHAHQSLVRADAQRRILDAHAGLLDLAERVAHAYRDWQKLARARVDHEANAAARNAEREQLAWQVGELDRLGPRAGEWPEISAEHSRLAHAASLAEGARAAIDVLSESEGAALAGVSGAKSALKPLLTYDPGLGEALGLLDSAEAQISEAAHALRRYADRVELDPGRLREVEERLEALHAAARRYRVAPEDLLETHESLRARLAELEIASDLEELIKHEQQSLSRYRELSASLTAERRKAATRLSKDVTAAMKELAMKGGRFEIGLNPYPPEGSLHGNESVEFLVATANGTEPRPLAKVASGGELSRISLAIQVITSRAAAVPTLIFDEVDAGIGGAVAEVVGRKLRSLGESRQVLCVTHLPQVAAQASQQWSVAKADGKTGTTSRVKVLDAKARIEEIARMLGGLELTATTRRHAAEMLGLRLPG